MLRGPAFSERYFVYVMYLTIISGKYKMQSIYKIVRLFYKTTNYVLNMQAFNLHHNGIAQ